MVAPVEIDRHKRAMDIWETIWRDLAREAIVTPTSRKPRLLPNGRVVALGEAASRELLGAQDLEGTTAVLLSSDRLGLVSCYLLRSGERVAVSPAMLGNGSPPRAWRSLGALPGVLHETAIAVGEPLRLTPKEVSDCDVWVDTHADFGSGSASAEALLRSLNALIRSAILLQAS